MFRRSSSRTPLAWKNLINDPRRLLLAAAGVGFAAVLMFTQNGFRNALLDSPVQLVRMVDADLVAISTARYMLPVNQRFSRDLLRRAAADPAVREVRPLFIERLLARVRVDNRPSRPIRVVSVPQASTTPSTTSATLRPAWLDIPGLDRLGPLLRRPNVALLDRKTRREFGFRLDVLEQQADSPSWTSGAAASSFARDPDGQVVQLAERPIELVGLVEIGTDFANEGTLLVSESSFAEYFSLRNGGRPLEVVDVGLIRLQPGAAAEEAARRLTSLSPQQWDVMTPAQLSRREQAFWTSQTPVGIIFTVGTVMGFAVGVIICYQILFTSIQDAMPEFATLKAMGYPNRYFVGLVVRQSIYLSVIGFLPALAATWGLFRVLEAASGLPMMLSPLLWRAGSVFLLTTLMCLISGLLALRKLLAADPASLF